MAKKSELRAYRTKGSKNKDTVAREGYKKLAKEGGKKVLGSPKVGKFGGTYYERTSKNGKKYRVYTSSIRKEGYKYGHMLSGKAKKR